jgi:hypothetical protein
MAKIQQLRSLAELNFCERCFEYYKALIEPSIKALLAKPLNDWVWVEDQITQMVMKSEGVFKTEEIIIPDKGEEEKYANQIDVKRFREIYSNRWGFKRKIDYLHEKGILQESSYKLLDKARKARNKIHGEPFLTELTEQDYALFSVANKIVSQLWRVVLFKGNEEFNSAVKSNAEKVAEWALSKIG